MHWWFISARKLPFSFFFLLKFVVRHKTNKKKVKQFLPWKAVVDEKVCITCQYMCIFFVMTVHGNGMECGECGTRLTIYRKQVLYINNDMILFVSANQPYLREKKLKLRIQSKRAFTRTQMILYHCSNQITSLLHKNLPFW